MSQPTIIVVHPRENRRKCSVESLRGDPRFSFWTFPERPAIDRASQVRLGIGGALLTPADASLGLVVLDGTWRLAERMERAYADLPVRSLHPEWRTAYPRRSKTFDDPAAGLATIEAIFAAHVQMGRSVDGLLDHYQWRAEFLALNDALINALSIQETELSEFPNARLRLEGGRG
jgi:pre-rRNA-processing protein TSR3